jgi:hypothetical protein
MSIFKNVFDLNLKQGGGLGIKYDIFAKILMPWNNQIPWNNHG